MAKLFKRKYWSVDPKTGERVQRETDNWYTKIKDEFGVWQRVTLCSDKTIAGLMADDLKRKAMKCQAGLADPYEAHRKRRLSEHLDDFEKSLEHKGNTATHCQQATNRARRIIDDCGFRRMDDLSASRVQRALAELKRAGLSQQTVNFHLQAIKQFCRWLVADRRMGENPLAHLQGGNVKLDVRLERRELADDEIRWFLESARTGSECFGLTGFQRYALYATAMGTGLRASELASLTPESFDFEALTVRIAAANEKARRGDVIPLPPDLVELLRPWLKTMPPTKRIWPGKWAQHKHASKFVQHDLKAARDEWLSEATDPAEREARDKSDFLNYRNHDNQQSDFHSLRHTYLSRLGRSGASPKVMQKLARHSTVELTLGRYTHAGLFDLSSAVNALPPLPVKDAPKTERAVMRATGTDDFSGPSTGPKLAPNVWASGPKLAQTAADARQRMSKIDNADGVPAEKEKPPNDRGISCKSDQLRVADNQRQAERGGFEPPVGLKPYTDLANRRIRPLCHLSDPRADGRNYTGRKTESNFGESGFERAAHSDVFSRLRR